MFNIPTQKIYLNILYKPDSLKNKFTETNLNWRCGGHSEVLEAVHNDYVVTRNDNF